MEIPTILQTINTVIIALFGTVAWRMINEWRKSREERHKAELEQSKLQLELRKLDYKSSESTHKHELEKRDIRIEHLTVENSRLLQKEDERIKLFQQEIELLKLQAPAGVSASFDALKKLHTEQLSAKNNELEKCQLELFQEKVNHENEIQTKNILIENLQAANRKSTTSIGLKIGIRSFLYPPDSDQRQRVGKERENIRNIVSERNLNSVSYLIRSLGHWDLEIREMAVEGLVALEEKAIPDLVSRLRFETLKDYILGLIGWLTGEAIQRRLLVIKVLTSIGTNAIPELEELLLSGHEASKVRALIVLKEMNTEESNAVLERHKVSVEKWKEVIPNPIITKLTE
jgi:hypothetical protein